MLPKISPTEYVTRMANAIAKLTEQHGGTCILELGWPHLVSMIGCLQLSLRHPSNRGGPARMMRDLIDKIYALIPPEHAEVVTLLKLGDDPKNDC